MNRLRVTTFVGTRPEIIRLSAIINKLDFFFEHRLIHTGQNSDPKLKDVFFSDFALRAPNEYFENTNKSFGNFLGELLPSVENELLSHKPDAVLILGDTNSSLAAIIAKRMQIPIYHLEAGNRSFDANVPEEINRRLVDHISDFNLVYSELARSNLVSEGIHPRRIALIGSPLNEVLDINMERIKSSKILEEMSLMTKGFVLASIHRQENVDSPTRLLSLLKAFEDVSKELAIPVIISTHPRTKKRIEELVRNLPSCLSFHTPFGFFDYVYLQINSRIVLSDSGSVSEESAILGFSAVILRDSMERPEALEAGSIVMAGLDSDHILESIKVIEMQEASRVIPVEYKISDTSTRVVNFLLSTVHQHHFWSGIRR